MIGHEKRQPFLIAFLF